MSDEKPIQRHSTIGRAKHFDSLCDEFETECSAGNRPSIESFLLRVDGPNKQPLLIELIAIEMHYRRRNGESVAVVEYQTRFPGLSVSRLEETILHSEKAHSQKTPAADQPTVDTRQGQSAQVESKLVKYFGDYELLDVIARGGMGIVYKARQVSLNRIVAIKMILSGEFASKEEVERFHSEAKAAALLDHPGIVPIYEVGEYHGKHFFSMTYVEGTSLAAKLNNGPLDPRQAARLMLDVTQAVQYAHLRGVIHRDLKPSNILLDLNDHPRVTDFGLAKRLTDDSGLTVSGQVLGTPSFMPPEQAAGQVNTIGPASDVYSLGAVLYSLTTGRPPFQGATGVETLKLVVEREPISPRQLNSNIPRDLETIMLKCLEKSVPRRYATASLLGDELQRFIDGRPIQARPIRPIEKAWRWCRREPVIASLLIAFLLTIGIGTVASIASRVYFDQRRMEAEASKLIDGLLVVDTTKLSESIDQLKPYRKQVIDKLKVIYDHSSPESNQRLHSALALLRLKEVDKTDANDSWLMHVLDRLMVISPEKFLSVLDLLLDRKQQSALHLWPIANNHDYDTGKRFRAAAALASLDLSNEQWKNPLLLQLIATQVDEANPIHLAVWQQAFQPVSKLLLPLFVVKFKDDETSEIQKQLAATLIAAYGKDDPKELSEAIVHADPESFDILFSPLKSHGGTAIDQLSKVLDRKLELPWNDVQLDTSWGVPDAASKTEFESAHGMLEERFAFVQDMPMEAFLPIAENLRAFRYRPIKVRMSHVDPITVAAVWTRDLKRWRIQKSIVKSALPIAESIAENEGLVIEDLSGMPNADENNEPTFIAVWSEPEFEGEERWLLADANVEEINQFNLTPQGKSARTISVRSTNEKQRRYTITWSSKGAVSETWPIEQGYDLPYKPQFDIAWAPTQKLPDSMERFRRRIAKFDLLSTVERAETQNHDLKLAGAYYWTGNLERALAEIDLLISTGKDIEIAEMNRGLFLARMNRSDDARKSLASFLKKTRFARFNRLSTEIQISAWLGDWDAAKALIDSSAEEFADESSGLSAIAEAAGVCCDASRINNPNGLPEFIDKAIALIERVMDLGYSDASGLFNSNNFITLRDEPRFMEIVSRFVPKAPFASILRADKNIESKLLRSNPDASGNTWLDIGQVQRLTNDGFRPVGIAVSNDDSFGSALLLHRPLIMDNEKEALALQQARAAIALLKMNAQDRVWPLLRHQPDPRVRSYLMSFMSQYNIDAASILARLEVESDPSRRRALIIGIGDFAAKNLLSGSQKANAITNLMQRYADDPDAGVHASCEWSIKQLGAPEALVKLLAGLANGNILGDRGWYVTKQGHHTMVVVQPESEILIGSPVSEADRVGGAVGKAESQYRCSLGRKFAIASHEVTVDQFKKFRSEHVFSTSNATVLDLPANEVSWNDALSYCNWLSHREGIPKDQWCYESDSAVADGMRLASNYLRRTGYRLPTVSEWEYACRAGSTTSRFYGETKSLMGRYAWYEINSNKMGTRPVGSFRPNDFGLFDMYGNTMEWCLTKNVLYPFRSELTQESEDLGKIDDTEYRMLRGGNFSSPPAILRSSAALVWRQDTRYIHYGFRPTRTLP